ncbi:hypothetical protein [Formosa sp. Hel1_31_208]|uniref:hypothetical protein n=1 Tax=Formosa sp. Hel1_31_208 TaxID=1798225 RepID=UPI000B81B96F|nr:hypothetical protein [Formosa sp. Hel1_31_208]
MKSIKYILASILIIAFISCEDDERDTDFINNTEAPSELVLQFGVTQDNTGLVTITPTAVGATSFELFFGDGSGNSVQLTSGESVDKVYAEGTYTLSVIATSVSGLTTQAEQELVVSFTAPQNLAVTIENDGTVSNTVRVNATADFGIMYEVDFGEDGVDDIRTANIGEEIVYEYQAAGIYTITVTAFSAAIETAQYIETDFEVTEILQPLTAAPVPPNRAEADVISMFSNAYDLDVNVSSWRSDWSTSVLTDFQIDGDDTKSYFDADFVGVEFYGADAVDASNIEFFHIDVWTSNATTFRIKLVDLGGAATEAEIVFDNFNQNEWVSIDIPMSDFIDGGMTATNSIQQLIFSGLPTGTFDFFIDNVYFYNATPSAPSMAAPTPPARPQADVISMFSNAYDLDVVVSSWRSDWSTSTLTDIQLDGDDTKRYEDADFVGVEFYGSPVDATDMEFFHIDIWTPDASLFRIKLVDLGSGSPIEGEIPFPDIQPGGWISLDIPLEDFADAGIVTNASNLLTVRNSLQQLIFSGLPAGTFDFYIDNVYFWRESATSPGEAAPAPTVPEANVISMYSNTYTDDVNESSWRSDWSTSILTDIVIDGNDVKEYIDADFVGVEFYGDPVDATSMTFFHIDVWTPNASTFRVKLVDLGSGSPVEGEIAFDNFPLGEWVSLEIPLADFADADLVTNASNTLDIRNSLQQLIFSGLPTGTFDFYIDNVYFHN